MNTTYAPRVGDRVLFYSWTAGTNVEATVLSVAKHSRLASVREDHEEAQTFAKSWDTLHLLDDVADQLRDEIKDWEGIAECARERAESAERRVDALEARHDNRSTIAENYKERAEKAERDLNHYKSRVEELESVLAKEVNRAEAAENRASRLEGSLSYSRDTVREATEENETLRSHLRADDTEVKRLRNELDELRSALATLAKAEIVPTALPERKPRLICDDHGDLWHENADGTFRLSWAAAGSYFGSLPEEDIRADFGPLTEITEG